MKNELVNMLMFFNEHLDFNIFKENIDEKEEKQIYRNIKNLV